MLKFQSELNVRVQSMRRVFLKHSDLHINSKDRRNNQLNLDTHCSSSSRRSRMNNSLYIFRGNIYVHR